MEWLLIVLVILAVAAGVVVYRQRQRQQEAQKRAAAPGPRQDPFAEVHGNERALFELKVGDLIRYHNADWWIRGTLRLDERGYTWAEHLISDFKDQHWLSVEEDEGVTIGLYDRVPPGDVGGNAGDDTVTYGDGVFKLVEQGEATFVAEGTTGTAPQGSARYADYESSDGRLLSFEQFGQQWEVSVGTHVLPAALDIFPVSD